MNFHGAIIEESLKDTSVLQSVKILSTKVEAITEKHKTPWLDQWTLHTVEIPTDEAEMIAQKISGSLDRNYWHADFKDDRTHYVIFPQKIFKIDRRQPAEYQAATDYGLTLNIPSYQLDFSPNVVAWER